MSTQVVPLEVAVPAFSMPRAELIHTMQNSLYPGAKRESVELVLSYCAAQRLDPLQKPVHIVPMWDKNIKAMRDVVMPGIGLYRVQAARTGEHAGTSEPEFGPDVELKVGEYVMTHPAWCKVRVQRRVGGHVAEFVAVEYWTENYATKDRDSAVPNAMWKKRPRGQLAKCAEAQALRKAFPELGAAPTAEEMEGKEFAEEVVAAKPTNEFMPSEKAEAPVQKAAVMDVDPETGEVQQQPAPQQQQQAAPAQAAPAPKADDRIATDGMKRTVGSAMKRTEKTDAQMQAKFGCTLESLPCSLVNEALQWARG